MACISQDGPKRLHGWLKRVSKPLFQRLHAEVAEASKGVNFDKIWSAASATPVRMEELRTIAKSAEAERLVNMQLGLDNMARGKTYTNGLQNCRCFSAAKTVGSVELNSSSETLGSP